MKPTNIFFIFRSVVLVTVYALRANCIQIRIFQCLFRLSVINWFVYFQDLTKEEPNLRSSTIEELKSKLGNPEFGKFGMFRFPTNPLTSLFVFTFLHFPHISSFSILYSYLSNLHSLLLIFNVSLIYIHVSLICTQFPLF